MKPFNIFLATLFLVSLLHPKAVAQQATKPDCRFSIRLNTLGLLSISQMLEFEYAISRRVAVFAGSGVGKQPVVHPFGVRVYRNFDNIFCKETGWSAYTGVRIALPIGKFVGLSVKGIVSYGHNKFMNVFPGSMGCTTATDTPQFPDMYYYNYLSAYGCVAYLQPFTKHLFIEPVLGAGPMRVARQWVTKSHHTWFVPAMQLNLGVRF